MKESKEYTVKSVSDIAELITLENFERFMEDFVVIFHSYAKIKEKYPETKFPSFVWIDDDKKELKFEFIHKDED